ncbi:phage major capsid protein [Nocardiopsis synnemataformans]|uniref:phage major capsid protein n=1 Tax=Nocardiopsis synnemataformans TaxID=61305 RepID=UPI003EB84592
MSDTLTMEALAAEIRQRLTAHEEKINEATESVRGSLPSEDVLELLRSDEAIKNFIRENLEGMLNDPEVQRKVRFGGGKSSEQLVGTKYARMGLSVSDVEMLHDITLAARKRGMGNGPSEELANTFKAVSEGRYEDAAVIRSRGHQQLSEMLRDGRIDPVGYERAVRAMDTAESGYGQQLIGAQYVNELWRGAQAQARVFGLVNSFHMEAPTAHLPVQATLPTVKFVGESTTSDAASYGSTKTGSNRVQVDAKKLLMLQIWSYELDEDSLIPFLPFLRDEATRSWAHHMDSILLNGDTTNAATGNINLDDANPDDDLYYLAFDGIRHSSLVDNTANAANVGGAITLNHFKAQKGRMLDAAHKHDWSHPLDSDELVYIADPETADAASFIDEALTVDKIGERATVLNGQQARILNHPLIASMDVSKTEADGKVSTTAANNTKGQLVSFNRRGYVVGTRSQMMVETDRDIRTQQNFITWSTRVGLGRYTPTGAASGIEHTDVLYNIDL